MKSQSTSFSLGFFLAVGLMSWSFVVTPSAHGAPTIWTGSVTNFDQANASSDVLVPGAVVLTRAFNHSLFNTVTEGFAFIGSPADTEWAFGNLSDYATLSYLPLYDYRNGDFTSVLVTAPPSPMVVHLINEDIYLSVTFSRWPHGGGAFAYTRSTPATVVAPPPTPTVSITSPTNAATLSAPANVTLIASASVGDGTVTNVLFFDNATLLGSLANPPFTLTTNNLGAGSYAFTAVATAAGISATSSVVNVSVVLPVVTSVAGSVAVNNQFSFSYSANPGLSYVVESSSNLFNWTPVVTNVATGNPAVFTNSILPGDSFFRVGRLPNP
jgi:hypothetical protein